MSLGQTREMFISGLVKLNIGGKKTDHYSIMKIHFHAELGTEIPYDMWYNEFWTHVPKMGDILQYRHKTYEVTTTQWVGPREINMWVKPC